MRVHIRDERIGDCAEEFVDVAVEFDMWLSHEALAAFHDLLLDVKRRAGQGCVYTEDFVQQALDEFPVANGRMIPLAHAYLTL